MMDREMGDSSWVSIAANSLSSSIPGQAEEVVTPTVPNTMVVSSVVSLDFAELMVTGFYGEKRKKYPHPRC